MQTVVGSGNFKTNCLKLLDDVTKTNEPVVITKRGKAVAKLIPIPRKHELFGALSGSVHGENDIISPLDEEWEACR